MDYGDAINYLYGLRESRIKLRLEHTRILLSMLGNPEAKLRFIHVAGTNGKGSVCAMISSILQDSGYRVGLFTSPHLNRFEERISLNGNQIEEEEVVALVRKVKPLTEEMKNSDLGEPTFFEVVTAMALSYFTEENADFAVLEVGLGGRLDATNVVNPLVSVITNIALDHQHILGNSLEEIAREKAGIIKDGGILVSGAEGVALDVIENVCKDRNSELILIGKDIKYKKLNSSLDWQEFDLGGIFHYKGLRIHLLGEHQLANASLTVGAIEALKRRGISIGEDSIRSGLRKARWPGRLEIVREKPLVVLDGAHNPAGIEALSRAISDLFEYRELFLIIGISKRKAIPEMIDEISPLADIVIASRFEGNSTEPELIAEEFKSNGKEPILKNEIPSAINYALSQAAEDDLVLVTGSLFTVAEARRVLLNEDV